MSAVIFMLALLSPALSAGAELSEYQIKAGFVFNITRFTDWPAYDLAKAQEIKICTLGNEPFNDAFDALNGKLAKGKPIAVSHLEQAEGFKGCNVLFISQSERKQFYRILKQVRKLPVLTISEVDDFVDEGGMVNLLIERNKTILEVNNASVQKANLKISAQVLKLARKIIE